jgi:hypothetical protein
MLFSAYSIIDQAVTLTYQKKGYSDTENDLEQLIDIINKTDLSKTHIEAVLESHVPKTWYPLLSGTGNPSPFP